MKKIHPLVNFIFLVTINVLFAQKNTPRIRQSFNEHWTFTLQDSSKFAGMDYNSNTWQKINLPHDWSITQPTNSKNSGRNAWLPGGIGWYRKTFTIPKKYQGKHIEIQFDGIYKNATVWLNNYPLGVQHDGYTSFYYDLTELIRFDTPNTIAIRVDNSIQPNCRWYSGSGIYRNTWLTIANQTHIKNWGTFITTPQITQKEATINLKTNIENNDEFKALTLTTEVYNVEKKLVVQKSIPVEVNRFSSKNVAQELAIKAPNLWSPTTPYLYTAVTTLKVGSKTIDQQQSTFGIRSLTFDAQKGFFINGKNTKMKGVCLHQDAGPFGAAVPKKVWEKRLTKLKAIGCNAIRTAHNPTTPEFLNLCDSLGFLVMNEFVDKWNKPYKRKGSKKNPFFDTTFADPNFSTEWKNNFQNTIERDRNHPSVIIWSVGNENHPPETSFQKTGLRTYTSFVRNLDPTRPVISGMERGKDQPVQQKVNHIIESCKYMDLIALNYGEQWCKLIHEQKPGKPYVSTESYVYFNSEKEKRFANIERSPWLDVLDNPQNMGLFLWSGIDYLGESKRFPKAGSTSGLFDVVGFRKGISYLYEAFWSKKPVVHIEVYEGDADDFSTSGRWGKPPTQEHWNYPSDKLLDVVTFTNCESVNLYLNNKLIGNQKLKDIPNWIMKWKKINYQPGTLKAVGVINNKEVCEHQITTAKKPHKINIKSDTQTLKPNAVIHVTLQLIDKKGIPVRHLEEKFSIQLQGDAQILGIHNGNLNTAINNRSLSQRETYKGKCSVILKTNDTPKSISLKISGSNIKTSEKKW